MNKENRPPADSNPDENEASENPIAGAANSELRHAFFSEFRNPANMGPHEEADEDVECAAVLVDASKAKAASLQSHVTRAGVGSAQLVVRYATNLTSPTWADLGPKVSLAVANAVVPRQSGSVLVPDASKINALLLKLVRRGGNGTLSPEMWNAILTIANYTSGTGAPPSDLPEDATWGNVIYDLNALGPLMTALAYGDGDDVVTWPNEKANAAWDVFASGGLLAPKWNATGFNSKPCVEWAGSNVPMTTASTQPTAAYGNYTYYFVVDGMDGGDGARLWGAGFGDSFQYSIYFNDTQFYAANNDLFGGASCFGTPPGSMSQGKIVRWVKNSGSAGHAMWIDGVFKCSSVTAPQTNNDGVAHLMHYLSGLGLSGRVARVVAYDRIHIRPDGTTAGGNTSGLTAPELVLQSIWGVP